MSNLEEKIFLLLVATVSLAFAWTLWPFFGAVLWAIVTAVTFAPLHRWLAARMGRRPGLAALATTTIVVVIVILPLTAVAAALVQEAAGLFDMIKSGELNFARYFRQVSAALPQWASDLLRRSGLGNLGAVQDKLAIALGQGSQLLATRILEIGQSTFELFVGIFMMVYLLFFLFRDGDALYVRIRRTVPLHADQQDALFTKFVTVSRAIVKGGVVVALLQGALGGLVFWFLGIQAPILWGLSMAFLSLLPAIGAGLIWLPVAIYLLATGAIWQGAFLIAFGVLVIGMVDNILRPALLSKDIKMPDYLVLFATLGGLEAFGLHGLVVGPAIAAMFIAIWEIFAASRQRGRVVA